MYTDKSGEQEEWCFQDGLVDYLKTELEAYLTLPETPLSGGLKGTHSEVTWALCWLPRGVRLAPEESTNASFGPTAPARAHVTSSGSVR